MELRKSWNESLWVLGPLAIFSLGVFALAPFWPSGMVDQPWYSLNLWRRDIGQPMLALLCGYWAFREDVSRRTFFTAQGIFIIVVLFQALSQFYVGENVVLDGFVLHSKGTIFVRGFSRDNIWFSYVLYLLTPGVLWLFFHRKGHRATWFRWLILLVLLYLIFVNKRRGTWIAFAIEIVLISMAAGWRAWIPLSLAILLLGAAAYKVRPEWFHRPYDEQQTGRFQILKDLQPLLLKHPVTGVGFGKDAVNKNYGFVIYQQAHNQFANIALEIGFPGLILWVGVLATYAFRLWQRRSESLSCWIGFAFIVGFCVRNLTDDVWVSSNAEIFWLTLGILFPSRKESV